MLKGSEFDCADSLYARRGDFDRQRKLPSVPVPERAIFPAILIATTSDRKSPGIRHVRYRRLKFAEILRKSLR